MSRAAVCPGHEQQFSGHSLVRLFVDGSWNPTVQRMGGGAFLLDNTGRWISGAASSFGVGTPFTAELLAMEMGLAHAWNLGFKYILCYTDCVRVTEVLGTDVDICNYWDRELIVRLRNTLRKEWKVLIEYLPRDRNNTADFMARQASRDASVHQTWTVPSTSIITALLRDSVT